MSGGSVAFARIQSFAHVHSRQPTGTKICLYTSCAAVPRSSFSFPLPGVCDLCSAAVVFAAAASHRCLAPGWLAAGWQGLAKNKRKHSMHAFHAPLSGPAENFK